MEETVKFEQYQLMKAKALVHSAEPGCVEDPGQLNPIILAYIGDVVFSLYVRLRLLPTSGQVRVLHDLGAKMVSAKFQAKAMDKLEATLAPEEAAMAKRGRNTKSTVPKSATVREYRQGTALETLVGWLYLTDQEARLQEFLQQSFTVIQQAMLESGGKKK